MDRSADNIGQVINDIQRDLEELKTTQLRGDNIPEGAITTEKLADEAVTPAKINQLAMTAGAVEKSWTTAPYASGYKASTNTGAPQSIQCCVWDGTFFLKFGVSPSSGNFDTNENIIGQIPLVVDGVDLTKMFSLDNHRVMRGFASGGAGYKTGFFGIAYQTGDTYVRLTLRCAESSAWMEGSIAMRVEE